MRVQSKKERKKERKKAIVEKLKFDTMRVQSKKEKKKERWNFGRDCSLVTAIDR